MARGVTKDALANAGTANNLSTGFENNANSLYGALAPQLEQEATNPQGYAPKDLAAMNTAVQQSTGGSTAGAVGQGDLAAARTRNAGAYAPALDASAQAGNRQNSEEALGVQAENANLKQKQQQAGLAGEQSLYGTNVGAGNEALGLSNNALGVAVNADNATTSAMNDWINDAENAAKIGLTAGNVGGFGK
jgi:hypothetical protein